jgi:tryptophan-rich sensory protein
LEERTWLVGAGFLALVAAYAVLSQMWVSSDPGWYASLRKPPWQPPDVVFGVIWPMNFLALAVTGVVLARRAPTGGAVVLAVLAVSIGLALGWAYLFYVPHALTPAALSLTASAALTWVVLVLAATAVWWLALVLLPYAVWLSLAASLAAWYAAQ